MFAPLDDKSCSRQIDPQQPVRQTANLGPGHPEYCTDRCTQHGGSQWRTAVTRPDDACRAQRRRSTKNRPKVLRILYVFKNDQRPMLFDSQLEQTPGGQRPGHAHPPDDTASPLGSEAVAQFACSTGLDRHTEILYPRVISIGHEHTFEQASRGSSLADVPSSDDNRTLLRR